MRGSSGPLPEGADQPIDAQTFRRVVQFFKPYWLRVLLTIVAILITAGLGLINPYLLRAIIDDAIPNRDLNLLYWLVGLMIGIPIFSSLIGVGQTYLNVVIGQGVMRDLRDALYQHLQKQSLRFFTATRTGEIQSRISNDVGGVQRVVTETATSVVSNIAIAVTTVIAMWVIDWRLTLISLAMIPIFGYLTARVGMERRKIATSTQRTQADITALAEETLSVSGILLTKAFGRQSYQSQRYSEESQRLSGLQVRQHLVGRWFFMMITTFFAITPAVVYLFAGRWIIDGSDAVSIGSIVAFTTLQSRLFGPVGQLLSVQVEIQGAFALFDRIFEYLDLPVEIDDRPNAIALRPDQVRGEIRYDNVAFQYDRLPEDFEAPKSPEAMVDKVSTRKPFGLSDINFEARPGQLVALVGPSGSGKSTISMLLPRLYDVTEGSVSIDGHDVRDIKLESLGQVIGMVTQETYLFHDTIRRNIAYGKLDATQAELEAAAKAAAIHDRIMELPDGYDTVVGERGYKLSGGEKQRIAIARVVLKNPPILILDEATSALDTASERLIQSAIETLMSGRTTIAIAHRLSTILSADQILVVERGRIVEHGTHAELLSESGLYAHLFNQQFASVAR
ncbi:MAG: ABC transporter ATP-binding protein [Thermomicrobiales bacterium]|nr:ABC transporter ATP-binding protein [Thermomicrobiales bacterium]